MSWSLTNKNNIIKNSFSIIAASGSLVDVLDAVQGSIVELPPAHLNTTETLSAAIFNGPSYLQTSQTTDNLKVPASTTHTKTNVDAALALKSDVSTTFTITHIHIFKH